MAKKVLAYDVVYKDNANGFCWRVVYDGRIETEAFRTKEEAEEYARGRHDEDTIDATARDIADMVYEAVYDALQKISVSSRDR